MEEFRTAYQKVVEGNKHYIIVVLVEDLDIDTLPNELQSYLRTYTYIDARNYENDLETIRKKIRFSMPGTPLEKIRQMQRDAASQQQNNEDSQPEDHVENSDDQEHQNEHENEMNVELEMMDETTNMVTEMRHNKGSRDDINEIHNIQHGTLQELEAEDHQIALDTDEVILIGQDVVTGRDIINVADPSLVSTNVHEMHDTQHKEKNEIELEDYGVEDTVKLILD